MLKLVDHSFGYRNHLVLHKVNLSVTPGESVAIVGESGAGKSTLLRQLYDLSPQTIALCPQSLGLVPTLSAFHNIYMGALSEHNIGVNILNLIWPQSAAWEDVSAVADCVGVAELLKKQVSQLSGGQRQRVALARSLLQGKGEFVTTFIGDEPVSSVDQQHGAQLIQSLKQQFSTVVVATHDRQLAVEHFDRVVGIRQGKVAFNALASELCEQDFSTIFRTNL
ncbi:hypothetical protein A9Q99_21450 [Gammaproteobacteria bacterium 45_16_T64]|nr:hypothetical protein A9Q99_21450 [Gammaproteobacteria bacterium 45_16_T64]